MAWLSQKTKRRLEKKAGHLVVQCKMCIRDRTATLWSGPDCAALGQYTAKLYPDGVAFEMSIGKEQKQLLVPAAFTVETYERKMCIRDS